MNDDKKCPDLDTLRRFLESEEVTVDEQHFETCAVCQTQLEALTSGAKFQSANQNREPVPDYLKKLPADGLKVSNHSFPKPAAFGTTPPSIPGFESLETIGCGGMGTVYCARQTSLDRDVAIKVISGGIHAGGEKHHRFRQEAKNAAKTEHPNVVRIYDYDELDELPFLVMELVDGQSLTQFRGQTLSFETIAKLIQRIASALHAVHAAGMVHRDVKPANILMAPSSLEERDAQVEINGQQYVPKLTDFGLSKELFNLKGHTVSGGILGTPVYMAPEQAAEDSKAIGPATDVHALGVVMYELLAGRRPFDGNSTSDTLNAIRFEPPTPVRHFSKDIPPRLEAICLKCLEKSPLDRFESAQQVEEELARYLRNESPLHVEVESARGRQFFWLGIALAFFVLACCGLALHIVTNKGQLIVKSDAENVTINVKRNAQAVANLAAKEMANGYSVQCGDIELTIEGANADSYSISPRRFVLKRNEDVVVRVIRKPLEQDIGEATGLRNLLKFILRPTGSIVVRRGGQEITLTDEKDSPDDLTSEEIIGVDFPASQDQISAAAIAELSQAQNLRVLKVEYSQFSDKHFAQLTHLSQLEDLDAFGSRLSNRSIPQLKGLQSLKRLSLGPGGITGDGLNELADLPIEFLTLEGCILHSDALRLNRFSKLKTLQIVAPDENSMRKIEDADQVENLNLYWRLGSFDPIPSLAKMDSLKQLETHDTIFASSKLDQLSTLNSLVALTLLHKEGSKLPLEQIVPGPNLRIIAWSGTSLASAFEQLKTLRNKYAHLEPPLRVLFNGVPVKESAKENDDG